MTTPKTTLESGKPTGVWLTRIFRSSRGSRPGNEAMLKTVRTAAGWGVLALCFLQGNPAHGAIVGPYTVDADTLHLWHFNEAVTPVLDVVGSISLNCLTNGAKLGEPSYAGFGTALSTYDGGPDAKTDTGRDAYLSVYPLVNGPDDNVRMTYSGPAGAFTYEAIVRIDFDPTTNFSTNAPGNGRGTFMEIIGGDADEPQDRTFQFRLAPAGLYVTNRNCVLLEFINMNKDKAIQNLVAPIPTTGPDAIRPSAWYHAAVTYSGVPNAPGNLKFYWTLLDPSRTAANLIGTGRMTSSLPKGCSPDFAIGQTGRQSPVCKISNLNFVGLIDEVRMSGIAREADKMMFSGEPILAGASAPASGSSAAGTVASTAPSAPVPAAAKANPAAAAKANPAAADTERTGGLVWLIVAALVVISGLLAWLIYVLKRMLSHSAGGQGSGNAAPLREAQSMRSQSMGSSKAAQATGGQLAAGRAQSSAGNNAAPAPTLQSGGGVVRQGSSSSASRQTQDEAAGSDGFRGLLRKVGLQDVIQMECLSAKSSILEIFNASLTGRIYIEHGEIIHAVAGGLSGESAFNKLLSLPGGEFSLKTFERPEERTIRGPWVALLMEAARTHDEATYESSAQKSDVPSELYASTPSTPDVLSLAHVLADHPQVQEVLICAEDGKSLYNSKCQDPAMRWEAISHVSQSAKALSDLLNLGRFDQVEILNAQSRTIVQPQQGCFMLIGVSSDAAAPQLII
jgi:hypothetical protein